MSKTDLPMKEMLHELKNLSSLQSFLEDNVSQLPLVKRAQDIVQGEGSQNAEIMLIGEAPGYHESIQRRPFVGRSGQLLRKTLKEINYPAEKVFISNIIKARPPNNRDPSVQEILAFKPFLDKEIELIKPKLVITLGRFSMAKFLEGVKISQIHGRLHSLRWQNQNLFILPMYHPAAALRSSRVKTSFIEDFNKIEKIIDWIVTQEETLIFKNQLREELF
ncbi:MAG: uracil-DNA glycosylase [Candidatus Pacebacteria bacterium]|jgi:DNA polymerase|nr:uracil-DNA glycosylase [Candidatus Paceibacterota bacterium]